MAVTNLAAIIAPLISALFIVCLIAGLAYYHTQKRKRDDKKRRAQRDSLRERSRSSQCSLPLQKVATVQLAPQPTQALENKEETKQEPQPDVSQIV